ncbi:MBOAT family protein [Echinicola marina]|uniref:MBOAT family O-acyltransferase n=1 Tax=Echinicola marina TaxID=2859768 RepID=UPI001CF7169D|nr:MBOAT family O-acyltransferase [Echinicola marina]UCS91929.1 MBOAT family protein [Echinicola marina]
MLFNSIEFLVFFPIVFLLYWFVFQKNLRAQNAFLLLASYLFYGWWDWRFLGLIAASSLVDYICGLKLAGFKDSETGSEAPKAVFSWFLGRKKYLSISLVFNLGVLGFFKYFNFFVGSASDLISSLGFQANDYSLQLILPIGISFYTFQTMSYTLDIYRGKMKPTQDIIAFFAYVSFFPQLVAGPIERAKHLLPQFMQKRSFAYSKAMDGMRQILWGLFKKMVIADNCAVFVDQVYAHPGDQPASNLALAAVFFSFQIYGDFSGYSDIAIGLGRLLGFDLMKNFAYPYFSRDIAEFWRRWHISLSSWFRDYVYIPLGGSYGGKLGTMRNVFIVFLVSGLWHGANWTFILWGGLNALFFLPLMLNNKHKHHMEIAAKGRLWPKWKDLSLMLTNFILVTLTWVVFRSKSVSEAWIYLNGLWSSSLFTWPQMDIRIYLFSILIVCFILLEWIGRENDFAIQKVGFSWPSILRYGFYYSIVMMIFLFATKEQEFIYFQF